MCRRATHRAALLLSLALFFAPTQAAPQLTLFSGVGYAAAGGALGAVAASGARCDGFLCIPSELVVAMIVGVGTGTWVGVWLGRQAEEAVSWGTPAPHLVPVSAGVVLGGTVLGLVATHFWMDRSAANAEGEGTFLGGEGQTLAIGGLIGAAASVLYLRSRWDELTGGTLELRPTLSGGRPGGVVSVRLQP